MTVSRDSESGRRVDGTPASGSGDSVTATGRAPTSAEPAAGGSGGDGATGQEPTEKKGVGLTSGAPTSFEPEEDAG